MLRQIKGMAEAMVIGDNRPALAALLWLNEKSVTKPTLEEIDRSVRHINSRLSHPEQVKRWAILADGPSLDSGELTGNLKLRRQVVLAQRATAVEMLYNGRKYGAHGAIRSKVPGILHIGENQCA
jgi:long-chain acyl-CoA synthetase